MVESRKNQEKSRKIGSIVNIARNGVIRSVFSFSKKFTGARLPFISIIGVIISSFILELIISS